MSSSIILTNEPAYITKTSLDWEDAPEISLDGTEGTVDTIIKGTNNASVSCLQNDTFFNKFRLSAILLEKNP